MAGGLEMLCGALLLLAAGPAKAPTPEPLFRRADIALGCSYLEEGAKAMPRDFGSSSSGLSATLVLRNVTFRDGQNLDEITEYKVPGKSSASSSPIVFEASAQSVSIPHTESLLHADCDEEVNCDISVYSVQQAGKGPCHASWFTAALRLSSGISINLLLRGPNCSSQEDVATLHPKLRIPMSEEGTLLTTVEFQLSSHSTFLRTHLGSTVTLDCHFELAPSISLSSLEWRRQHQGSSRSLFQYQEGSKDPKVQPKVHVDVAELLGSGDASLSLQEVSVEDEGTYICLVSTPLHQAQLLIQLHVAEPPTVHVTPAVVSFEGHMMATLTCIVAGYYPLDVSVSWTQKTPEGDTEIPLSNIQFSSHQRSGDGTYSITSYLSISSATAQAPAIYSCHVSHVALAEPVSASAHLKAQEQMESEGLVGHFIATIIFIAVLFIVLRRRAGGVELPLWEKLSDCSEVDSQKNVSSSWEGNTDSLSC